MADAASLGRCELFAGLDAEVLADIIGAARPVSLVRHQVLFSEGDPAEELYLVREGRVAILRRAPDGRESVVAIMGAGDVFGEMSLFDGHGRSADARALDAAQLVAMPYPMLAEAFGASPPALWAVLRLLAGRIRATDEILTDAMFLDVPGRTAKRLLTLAGHGGGYSPAVTQDELASMVGASRERINRAIATFVRNGWLEQSGRRYRVLDAAQLASRAR